MGLFSRRGAQPAGVQLPRDFARRVEQYGRWTFDPRGSGLSDPGLDEYELYTIAQANPDGFISAVADVALPAGGWAAYGGARAVWNAVGTNSSHPGYLAMLDVAIDFVVQQFGTAHLAPFEMRRLRDRGAVAGS